MLFNVVFSPTGEFFKYPNQNSDQNSAHKSSQLFSYLIWMSSPGLLQAGVLGGQFLTDLLTLSQPGEHIDPTQYYKPPPPDFQTLRRPCIGWDYYVHMKVWDFDMIAFRSLKFNKSGFLS